MLNRAFAIDGFAQCVDYAPKPRLGRKHYRLTLRKDGSTPYADTLQGVKRHRQRSFVTKPNNFNWDLSIATRLHLKPRADRNMLADACQFNQKPPYTGDPSVTAFSLNSFNFLN